VCLKRIKEQEKFSNHIKKAAFLTVCMHTAVTTSAPVVAPSANSEEEEVIAEDYDSQKKDTINNNVNDSEYVDDFMGNLEKKLMVTMKDSSCQISICDKLGKSFLFAP
jgi:hypothetical protein